LGSPSNELRLIEPQWKSGLAERVFTERVSAVKRAIITILALALLVGGLGQAKADPAMEFTGSVNDFTSGTFSLGWSFSTNTAVTVTALGFFDDSTLNPPGPGLSQPHDVGIYDSSGNLLVSTTVLQTDPLIGHFRYDTITPYILPAGLTFTIAAETGNDNYTWDTTGFTVDASINFVQDEFVLSSSLAFPTESAGITGDQGGAWFGPDFTIGASAVPEPGSLTLAGLGVAGMIGYAWRRRRAAPPRT